MERCVEQLKRLLDYFGPYINCKVTDETVAGMIIAHWESKLGRDAHGTILHRGQDVLIHEDNSWSRARVETVHPETHTLDYPGCWVEVRKDGILVGYPSYRLSVIPPDKLDDFK